MASHMRRLILYELPTRRKPMYLKIAVIGVVPLCFVLVRLIDNIEEPERTTETVVHDAIARELWH